MKKRNEDDPDNLGGLGGMLPAEVLKMLNELLEQQHRTGHPNNGSKIEFVYVASGGQHVETQINIGETRPHPLPKGRGVDTFKTEKSNLSALPDVLCTKEAMTLWEKAKAAGYVDDDYQPLISRTQSSLLAFEMAKRLGIHEKWKVFEAQWNRKNMYRDYYKALNLQQSLAFQDEIKKLFR